MASQTPLTPIAYYEKSPSVDHRPGDIWSGLPTYGVLGELPISGIVITPACDFANLKAEAVTFLPIIPVPCYFSSHAVLPRLFRRMEGLSTIAGISSTLIGSNKDYECPSFDQLDLLQKAIGKRSTERLNEKAKAALKALELGTGMLMHIASPNIFRIDIESLNTFFGQTEWEQICEKIVRNNLSSDIHFLPSDGAPAEWSAVRSHSIVLFRYPLTIPLQILNLSIFTPSNAWSAEMVRLRRSMPAAKHLESERPIKRGTIKSQFFSDMLSRYLSLYIRLGAPSFSDEGVEQIRLQFGVD